MDTFERLSAARQSDALTEKVALLDHMRSIFAELHDRFPHNSTFSKQLDAILRAQSQVQRLTDGPALTSGEMQLALEEVEQIFRAAGATETDLKQWGL